MEEDRHSDDAVDAAPEVDRVNVEPAILLGLSSSEALMTIAIAFTIWTPVAAAIAVFRGSFPLFVLLAATVPMATVWLAARKMAAIKRNRPDMYYVHVMRIWAARKGLRRSRYVTHSGEWDLGRAMPEVAPINKDNGLTALLSQRNR